MEELSSIKFDKLTEENYVTWSHRMRWVLELKGLWQAVEEESTGTTQDRECWYCHKKGHVKADCLKRKRDNAAASVIPL